MTFRTRPIASLVAGTLAAATIATTSGGCIMHGRERPLAYAGDAALLIAGGLLLHSNVATCSNPADMCPTPENGTSTLHLVGGTLLAVGAVGLALQLSNDLQPERAPQYPEAPPVDTSSDDVHALTASAKESAKAGACADVINLGSRVRALDPIYYRHVFTVDDDIRSCLQ